MLTPLLALPTAILMRMAVVAARQGTPRWSLAGSELWRLPGRKVALGALQLVILLLAITNILLSGEIDGLPGALSTLVAGYAVIATSIYAVALWPIVCDPAREAPIAEQLRLALGVVMLRPLQMFVLALITALAVVVSVQLIVPAIFLPSIVLLAVAHYVVPAVDRLRPVDA